MVMFRDDELRMIAEERAQEPRWKKRTRKGIKIVLSIAALFCLSLTVMSMLSGNGDSIKAGVSDYIHKASGLDADITTLHYMSFFPEVRIDFSDLDLYIPAPQPLGKKGGKTVAPVHGEHVGSVGHFEAAMGFWDLFFSRHTLRVLTVEQAKFAPGLLDRRAIDVRSLRLDPKGWQGKPAILFDGKYGDEQVSGLLEMAQMGSAYGLPDKSHFDMTLGLLHLTGSLSRDYARGLVFTLATATIAGQAAPTGVLVLSRDHGQTALGVDLASGHSRLDASFIAVDGKTQGTIAFPVLDIADLRPMLEAIAEILGHWPGVSIFSGDLSASSVVDGDTVLGALTTHAEAANGVLRMGKIGGTLNPAVFGAAGKQITIDANGTAITLPALGVPQCLSARLAMDANGVTLNPILLTEGTQSFAGSGRIAFDKPAVNLSFKPATANAACALP
jgi:hypothetical protein